MAKYIDAGRLMAEIKRLKQENTISDDKEYAQYEIDVACGYDMALEKVLLILDSLRQEQPNNMIQWTGNNLKEVINFTGKSPRFGEWFKSWEEYENYVHTHNDILKLFFEDGSHYEVPIGAWIIKTPDGYNVSSVAKYIQQEQPEVDLEKEIERYCGPYNKRPTPDFFDAVARHFYELGCRRTAEMYDDIECNRQVAEEKQTVDGLDAEIDACWQKWLSPSNQKEVEGVLPKTEFAMYARHFAELGKKNTLDHVVEWMKKNLVFTHPRKGEEACIVNIGAFLDAMNDDE